MDWPRLIGLSLALGMHGGVLYTFFAQPGRSAFGNGTGLDNFTVIAEVNLESTDLFTQRAQEPGIDRNASQAAPPPIPEKQEPKIEPAEKTETKAPLPQQTADATPKPAEPPPEQPQTVTQTATLAQKPQIDQQAAAALAARRDELGLRYLAEFSSALERYKVRPHSAKEGNVLLQITVAPSGQLLDHSVMQSSGTPELDRAAIAALEHAAPFPPLPAEFKYNPLTFTVPFRFRIR